MAGWALYNGYPVFVAYWQLGGAFWLRLSSVIARYRFAYSPVSRYFMPLAIGINVMLADSKSNRFAYLVCNLLVA